MTLYEAVEGEPPFPRHNPTAALTDPPLPPAHAGRLAPLLANLLEKDPDRRPDADSALARLRALPGTVRGTAPGTPLDDASQATTKVLHPSRTRKSEPEQPPSSTGPLTITTSRVGSRVTRPMPWRFSPPGHRPSALRPTGLLRLRLPLLRNEWCGHQVRSEGDLT